MSKEYEKILENILKQYLYPIKSSFLLNKQNFLKINGIFLEFLKKKHLIKIEIYNCLKKYFNNLDLKRNDKKDLEISLFNAQEEKIHNLIDDLLIIMKKRLFYKDI
jgi:hypothetical protein